MAKNLFDTNAEDVSDWFEEQADEFEEDVQDMLEQAERETHEAALEKVPVDTGRLRDSLQRGDNSVYSDVEYAPHVGLGTVRIEGTDYLWGPAEEAIRNALEDLSRE
jgi:hypothetical protein